MQIEQVIEQTQITESSPSLCFRVLFRHATSRGHRELTIMADDASHAKKRIAVNQGVPELAIKFIRIVEVS